MKYKLTRKMILYFSSLLIVFSLIVGILFLYFFNVNMVQKNTEDLKLKTMHIANTLSEFSIPQTTNESGMHRGNQNQQGSNGYGAYLRFLNDSTLGNAWLVDKEAKTIQVGRGMREVTYSELPKEAFTLIDEVFQGEIKSSDSFSSILEDPTITVGAPVYNQDGEVVAALLLHSEVSGLQQATIVGIQILAIVFVGALILVFILSLLLVKKLVTPLQQMEVATAKLIAGDYHATTGIAQNDEIGSLANYLDTLSQRLLQSSEEIEQMEQARKDFIASISHELRTPVTVIRASVEGLRDGVIKDPDKVKQYYQQIVKDSIHLERLVNDLLELSRLTNPAFSIVKEPVNLIEILEDAVYSMQKIAQTKQIQIELHKNEKIYIMDADYARIRQMFIIVIDNAIKFSSFHSKINIDAFVTNSICNIKIQDFGDGIKQAHLNTIFERFFSLNKEEGTGLGLSIASEVAKRHAIKLTIESEEGLGTCVTFLCK